MATRVHVAAALSQETEAFEREVSGPRQLKTETSGPWTYATASVWNTSGSDLDRGLARLPCPTLRVTTVDAALFEIRLQMPDREPVAATHRFNLLDPEMADEFEDYEDLLELAEDGWIQPEQVAALAGLGAAEAMAKVKTQSDDDILEAVAALGLPGDAGELRAILEGTGLTTVELEWDVGNLPRFLSALGLEAFGDWRQQIDNERQEEQERLRAAAERPAEDLVLPLEQALEGVEPQPLEGDPVVVRLQHLILVPWACNKDLTAGVRVTLPRGTTHDVDRMQYPDMEIVQAPGSLRIGSPYPTRDASLELCAELQPLLDELPEGTAVELVCAEPPSNVETMDDAVRKRLEMLPPEVREKVLASMASHDDDINTAGNHIYSGVVRQGILELSAAHPPVSAQDLQQACDLFAAACQGEALPVSDEEAAAVLEAAQKDIFLEDEALVHRDGALTAEDAPCHMAVRIFRQRFRHAWDVEQAEAAELELWEEYHDDPFGSDLDDAPPVDEVLLEGSWSTFHGGTMEGWQGVTAEDLASMDARMKGLGLEPLGDLVALAAGSIVLRGYGAADAPLFATWMVGAYNIRVVDLFTTFKGKGSLTTTNNPVVVPNEPASVYKQSFPGLEPDRLFEQHKEKLASLADEGHTPGAHEPDLIALARSIDEFMG